MARVRYVVRIYGKDKGKGEDKDKDGAETFPKLRFRI
jgi:hypothetical protein